MKKKTARKLLRKMFEKWGTEFVYDLCDEYREGVEEAERSQNHSPDWLVFSGIGALEKNNPVGYWKPSEIGKVVTNPYFSDSQADTSDDD